MASRIAWILVSISAVRAGTSWRERAWPGREPLAQIDGLTEPHHGPARGSRRRLIDAQEIFLALHQRFGNAFDRGIESHVVARIAEDLDDQEEVLEIVAGLDRGGRTPGELAPSRASPGRPCAVPSRVPGRSPASAP